MALTVKVSVSPRLTVLLPIGLSTNAGPMVAVVCETALVPKVSVTVKVTVYIPVAA